MKFVTLNSSVPRAHILARVSTISSAYLYLSVCIRNAEAAAEMWSSSSESSGAPVRRGMRRAKHELRHGIIGYAIDGRHIDAINGLPYITHTQHDLDGLPGYSSYARRVIARRQAALRNCPYN